jgi:CrcB protein
MAGFAAVGVGAALGAWLRWALGAGLNAIQPGLPLGTLVANLAGGYLIGVAVAWLDQAAHLPPELRLFIITGFLGGLTTFSTFSAETVGLLDRGAFGWACALVALHVCGSVAATIAGVALVRRLAPVAGLPG